ncbi:HNH endonuclease signature motif containing protein [Gymnodinialimonas sp.]
MEQISLSSVLIDRNIDPSATKLYRHSYGVSEVWEQGATAFLLFSSLQSVGVFGPKLRFLAHFLPEQTKSGRHAARFLGVTQILSEPRLYDGLTPPLKEIAAVDPFLDMSKAPQIVEQKWQPAPEDDPLSEVLLIDMGTPRRPIWAERNISVLAGAPEAADAISLGYVESRSLRLHIGFERRAMPAELVKAARGFTCEGCDLDAETRYGKRLASRVIEAHHRRPIAELSEGTRRVSVDDFFVLCATCHRLIHGLPDVSDLQALRDAVAGKFRPAD